jgi:hypothetical protein
MGGVSPSGHKLEVNSRYLSMDGKPWLPVMGEFHFARYPEKYWQEELAKMKPDGEGFGGGSSAGVRSCVAAVCASMILRWRYLLAITALPVQ